MQDNILPLIGRTAPLFEKDISVNEIYLSETIRNSRFLVIGGAGTIGSAICRELFARNPKVLHVVDISENNMVELVRDIRSSVGYGDGEFATFALDCGSEIFRAFINEQKKRIGGYDYVFNTSTLKHVRSEKDPYTLMRMIDTNIFNTDSTMLMAKECGAKKYFCVSTDNWCKSVLFVYEYFSTDNDNANFLPLDKNIWIEHILPETVNSDSPWRKDFSQEEIDELTHCIGNLTPLSLRKNIQAQNYSFDKKKEAYGKKDNIATSFYMTQQILAETTWTPEKIRLRKAAVVSKLNEVFELQ